MNSIRFSATYLLQFMGGSLAGALGALRVMHRRNSFDIWLGSDCRIAFIAGCALMGGGVAALLAERLWNAGTVDIERKRNAMPERLVMGGIAIGMLTTGYAITKSIL